MSKFEFQVPGTDFSIKANTIYKVTTKVDPEAPDGFVEHKTTKVIHPDVTTSVGAPYDVGMEAWNTGFYKSSPCLRGMSDEQKEAIIKVLTEHIVKPVEAIKGEGRLSHDKSNEFWDSFRIPLGTEIVFNTANPIELLQLYLAILGKNLAPKEMENHPNFKKAQFCVVNNEDAVSVKQERDLEKLEANGLFYTLYQSDKDKLFKLMDYLGIVSSDKTDMATLSSAFMAHLEDKSPSGYQNSKIFIDTFNKFSTERGEQELYLYGILKELYKKNIVRVVRGEVYLDDISLGNSFKLAAEAAAQDLEITKKLVELSQND